MDFFSLPLAKGRDLYPVCRLNRFYYKPDRTEYLMLYDEYCSTADSASRIRGLWLNDSVIDCVLKIFLNQYKISNQRIYILDCFKSKSILVHRNFDVKVTVPDSTEWLILLDSDKNVHWCVHLINFLTEEYYYFDLIEVIF